MIPLAIAVLAFVPMIVEAIVSGRNERALRDRGATEPKHDVFRVMQVAYPAAFAAIVVEAWLRQVPADAIAAWGALLFLAAKGLKYWAIATLGVRWTFRVLVPPASTRIAAGPYRVMRHPNYVAVIGELAGAAVMGHAVVTGPWVTLGFALLILRRIIVEERALQSRGP